MAMGTASVSVTEMEAQAIGTGETEGDSEVVLCRMALTPNERAALFEGYAISDRGEERTLRAIGVMVPEAGYEIRATGENCGLAISVNSTTVDFSVRGAEAGTSSWHGRLTAVFTRDYGY